MTGWHLVTGRHFLSGMVILAVAGCSTPPDPRRTNFEIRAEGVYAKYDPKTGRLTKLDADTNKNGKIDSFSYWDGATLHRIEVDQDEDGKIDRWEHYGERNKMTRVGSSSKDDQVEDTWTYPDANGFLSRVDSDTNRDGVVDKRETFVPRADRPDGRVLQTVELDIDATGKPGRRLFYRPDGSFDRVETLRP